MKSWFDDEVNPLAWFDADSQLSGGWFDSEQVYSLVVTFQAICINTDGSLVYKPTATASDNKLYLNNGEVYARLIAVGGDRLLSLAAGQVTAT
jgi:hypothetical protein